MNGTLALVQSRRRPFFRSDSGKPRRSIPAPATGRKRERPTALHRDGWCASAPLAGRSELRPGDQRDTTRRRRSYLAAAWQTPRPCAGGGPYIPRRRARRSGRRRKPTPTPPRSSKRKMWTALRPLCHFQGPLLSNARSAVPPVTARAIAASPTSRPVMPQPRPLRKIAGLSDRAIAEKTGIGHASISRHRSSTVVLGRTDPMPREGAPAAARLLKRIRYA